MASESVAIEPEKYDAPALKGNFTTDAEMHLWCAQALAIVVGSRDAMDAWNDLISPDSQP